MNIKKIRYVVEILLAAVLMVMLMTACAGDEPHPVVQLSPGDIAGNIYLSEDGRFTLEADSEIWQTAEEKGSEGENLYLKKESNVWVSFSDTPGLTKDMVETFETSFVESYMEGVRVGFPDAEAVDSEILSDQMARIDITMTYGFGLYPMRQILYLVTDGENGYIITASLPEAEAETLNPAIYKLVESLRFTEDTPQSSE